MEILLHAQSAHIAQGVDAASGNKDEVDAGDQGIMFRLCLPRNPGADAGAACSTATKSSKPLADARHAGKG